MKRIDLNCDLGEGQPHDRALLQLASSANVCCGAHAGSLELTHTTIALCREHGVRIGAHPGVPDRAGMGRRPLEPLTPTTRASLLDSLREQTNFVVGLGATYLKPHGELYNAAAKRQDVAEVLTLVLTEFGLPLLGLPETLHTKIAGRAGVRFYREAFADRRYTSEGTLVPRSESGAVLESPEEAAEQALRLAPNVDSLCVHGDSPNCVLMLSTVRASVLASGYEVAACD